MKSVSEHSPNPEVITGTFYFDPSDSIYNGHFPGHPVVPGSMIVHAFLEAIEAAGLGKTCRMIEEFKFREFVHPGECDFSIHASPNGLKCRLYQTFPDRTKTWVTGTIKI